MIRRPRAVPVHDLGKGGVAVSGRVGHRTFVRLDEGVEVARPGVVEKGAVVVDDIAPAVLLAIAESESVSDADEGIDACRVHPVATEIEGLSRDDFPGPGTAADAMRCLDQDERQAVGRGELRGGEPRRACSHDDDINGRAHKVLLDGSTRHLGAGRTVGELIRSVLEAPVRSISGSGFCG